MPSSERKPPRPRPRFDPNVLFDVAPGVQFEDGYVDHECWQREGVQCMACWRRDHPRKITDSKEPRPVEDR